MTREEAIDIMKVVIHMLDDDYDDRVEIAIQMAIEALSAKAVQGEWKPFDLTWGRNIYFCTACKESTEVQTVNGQPSYNFCPNCGAKMDKE